MTFDLLFYTYAGLLAYYMLIGLFFWNKLNRAYRLMVFNVGFALLTEVIAWQVIVQQWLPSNFEIFIPYIGGSFILYVFFFSFHKKDRLLRVLSWFTIAFMPVFTVVNYFLLQDPGRFSSNVIVLGSVFLIGACLRTLYLIMKNADEESIYQKSSFWMSTLILFYYTLIMLYFSFFNYRIKNLVQQEVNEIIEIFFRYLNVLFYLALNLIFIKELLFSQPAEQKQEV